MISIKNPSYAEISGTTAMRTSLGIIPDGKIVHSRLSDMKSKHIDDEDETFKKPTDDEICETTEATRDALEKIITAKIAASLPVQHAKKTGPSQYIRYTPSQQSGLHASGAQQRIIRLVEEQKDPMEPPRFQINQKIPRAPPSPPAPVLHSPTHNTQRAGRLEDSSIVQRSQALRKAEADEDSKAIEEAKEREAIRRDRVEDHRKERNIARSRPDKLEKLKRDKDRDISEKIALGLPDSRTAAGTQFDSRLFNQTGGLDSGGIDDETYTAYDKPWRPQDNVQQHIYRPRKDVDSGIYGADLDRIINTSRFVPDKGFAGTDGEGTSGARGSGPVQFEREEEDIFGLGELLQTGSTANVSSSSKRKVSDEGCGKENIKRSRK
uniref:SKIP_SNW domain-containing protein n=1 Tax=Meloidogyne hapla TaxID=6305 RepID=A0A1I8BA78_MELHA